MSISDDVGQLAELAVGKVSRKDMPQIKSADMGAFLIWVRKQGHQVTTSKSVRVGDIKPMQRDIDPDKVKQLKKASEDVLRKAVVLSKDNYLLDGHHRWAALRARGASETFPKAHRVHVDVETLFDLAHRFPKSFKKGIHEYA